jgi:hypothetical protein
VAYWRAQDVPITRLLLDLHQIRFDLDIVQAKPPEKDETPHQAVDPQTLKQAKK